MFSLKPGTKLEVIGGFTTPAGEYMDGDILELIEPTDESPFGHSSRLCNWYVKCKHFTPPEKQSVWASIWWMIEVGQLEPVSNK